MKTYFTIICSFLVIIASAQKQKRQTSQPTVIKDVAYAWYPSATGADDSVRLDVYMPTSTVAEKKFPLILLIHGGGFRKGDKGTAARIAEGLADTGFVTVSMNYRIGWDKNENDRCDTVGARPDIAFYKAQQDARAALRFLVANAEKYNIDTNWIFVQGASAGAVTALNLVYLSQDSADKYLPNVSDSFGLLDTAGNGYRDHYTIKALGVLWGAMSSPNLITAENAVPTIFFHGERDRVVPWDADHYFKCPNFPLAYGTQPLYKRMRELNKPAVAIIDPQGGHGIYDAVFREKNVVYYFRKVMENQPPTKWIVGQTLIWNAPSEQ